MNSLHHSNKSADGVFTELQRSTLNVWRRIVTRQILKELDDHQLKDVGIAPVAKRYDGTMLPAFQFGN